MKGLKAKILKQNDEMIFVKIKVDNLKKKLKEIKILSEKNLKSILVALNFINCDTENQLYPITKC
jgi:hypothetical protein